MQFVSNLYNIAESIICLLNNKISKKKLRNMPNQIISENPDTKTSFSAHNSDDNETNQSNRNSLDMNEHTALSAKIEKVYTNNRNTGSSNTGSLNSGDLNTGDYNLGDSNSGSRNEGSFNSGDFNRGSYNSGDWNYGNGCSGIFCTEEAYVNFFDKPSNLTISAWHKSEACRILMKARPSLWVPDTKMTLVEKLNNPDYVKNGGFLKTCCIKEAFEILWASLSVEEQSVIINMPNFDSNKFLLITGIKV